MNFRVSPPSFHGKDTEADGYHADEKHDQAPYYQHWRACVHMNLNHDWNSRLLRQTNRLWNKNEQVIEYVMESNCVLQSREPQLQRNYAEMNSQVSLIWKMPMGAAQPRTT